jgi:HSP20 family molecular chaperone IbpA
MALAGFNKDDIVIECGPENSFEISYENKEEVGEKSRRIARRNFKKTFFDYGAKLDLEAAVATFENGLLKIAIPQKERKSLYKSIDIK